MKKFVLLDVQAEKELLKLPNQVQKEFSANFYNLRIEGKLEYPHAKKVDKSLFEIRIKVKNIYRGFYAYIKSDQIIILHIFQKKTQNTPLQNLKIARKRLKAYD